MRVGVRGKVMREPYAHARVHRDASALVSRRSRARYRIAPDGRFSPEHPAASYARKRELVTSSFSLVLFSSIGRSLNTTCSGWTKNILRLLLLSPLRLSLSKLVSSPELNMFTGIQVRL